MTPSLLLEEPPAQTSAKEPWVSGGPQSGLGVSSASLGGEGWGEGWSWVSLPSPAAGPFPLLEASWGFLPPEGLVLRPPVSPALGWVLRSQRGFLPSPSPTPPPVVSAPPGTSPTRGP